MNNSSVTDLLQRLSDEKAILHIPAFIFMGILMFTGFIGNTFVCYFYGCKSKVTPTSCFIVGLAILDLISCTVSIPMEIVDIRFFYMFPDATACKVLRTTNFVCTISSGIILVAIATERYRRICLPFRKQITVLQAKLICVISTLMAFMISWPGFIFFAVVPVDVPLQGSDVIQGYDCTTVKGESLRIYLLSFCALHILLFIVAIVAIIVLYFLVYRQLIRGKKFRQKCKSPLERSSEHKNSPKHQDTSTDISISSVTWIQNNDADMKNNIPKEITNVETKNYKITKDNLFVKENFTNLFQDKIVNNEESNMPVESEKQYHIVSQHEHDLNSIELSESVETVGQNARRCDRDGTSLAKTVNGSRFVSSSPQKKSRDLTTDKYTTIMFLVTVIFIVSFLPYLCLAVWQSFSVDYLVNRITDWQLVLFTIGVHSYFLNSAINPFIYGFFNSQFRKFIASSFVCAFRCRKDQKTSRQIK